MPSVAMLHEKDPREELSAKVGDLSGIELFGADVLLAVYQRPSRTASGIYLTDTQIAEDKWQGKAHLIVKMGPMAFQDDENMKFRDEDRCKVGDWVVIRPSDGQLVTLNTLRKGGVSRDNTVLCRIAKDISIKMRISHPDQIF